MKKISTLIIACLAISLTSIGQDQSDQGRGYRNNSGYDNGRYGNGGYNNNDSRYNNFRTEADLLRNLDLSRQQERRIMRINEEYRDKISRLQNNRWMSAQQKRSQQERLEQQRRQEIMNVLSRFQRDRYNAWCSRNNTTYGNGGYNNGRW